MAATPPTCGSHSSSSSPCKNITQWSMILKALMHLISLTRYIKMGQTFSSRADLLPPIFVDELSMLQDAVPPSPFEVIAPILEKYLGGKVDAVFSRFDTTALASASIAQVHRAVLKDGTEVVVKVQHPEIHRLLDIDLTNIVQIFATVGWLEPDFDFSIMVREWASEVRNELDFNTEAENLKRAHDAAERSGLDVVVPKPLFSSKNILVMTFCEGVKAGPDAFADPELDRSWYVRMVCEIFAYLQYNEGFFNGGAYTRLRLHSKSSYSQLFTPCYVQIRTLGTCWFRWSPGPTGGSGAGRSCWTGALARRCLTTSAWAMPGSFSAPTTSTWPACSMVRTPCMVRQM
jgi:hypothetical protein